jgi:hypothetical protein
VSAARRGRQERGEKESAGWKGACGRNRTPTDYEDSLMIKNMLFNFNS